MNDYEKEIPKLINGFLDESRNNNETDIPFKLLILSFLLVRAREDRLKLGPGQCRSFIAAQTATKIWKTLYPQLLTEITLCEVELSA